jgi:release factor glutamine methyltransferase
MENLPQEVQWEPRLALEAGSDGLDLYRRIIPRGHLYLKDQGFMALEMGADMGKVLRSLFGAVGRYSEASVQQDYAGRERIISARKVIPPGNLDRKG